MARSVPRDEARFRLVFRVDARIGEEEIARDDASVVHRDLSGRFSCAFVPSRYVS
jgi:hypothetical protein